MAVQRSVEELDTRIQAIIKEKCTAIHPVVEWRFRKAVLNSIERQSDERPGRQRRDGADRVRGRLPALRARRHPRLVRPAEPGHPGRSPHPARPRRRRDAGRAPGAIASRPRRAAATASTSTTPRSSASLNSGDEVEHHRLPARERREPVRLPGRVRPRGARADRGVPGRARRAARHGLPAAPALRGERHAHRRGHLRATSTARSRPRRRCSRTTSRSRRRTASTTRSTSARACSRTAAFDPICLKNLRLWQLMLTCGDRAPCPSAPRPAAGAAGDDAPDPRPARAAVDPLPLRREALRRRRRVRHPLRDRQEAHRQGGRGGDDGPGDPARQDRHRLQPERRGAASTAATSSTCRAWATSPARSRTSTSRSCRACRASGRSASRSTSRTRGSSNASSSAIRLGAQETRDGRR